MSGLALAEAIVLTIKAITELQTELLRHGTDEQKAVILESHVRFLDGLLKLQARMEALFPAPGGEA